MWKIGINNQTWYKIHWFFICLSIVVILFLNLLDKLSIRFNEAKYLFWVKVSSSIWSRVDGLYCASVKRINLNPVKWSHSKLSHITNIYLPHFNQNTRITLNATFHRLSLKASRLRRKFVYGPFNSIAPPSGAFRKRHQHWNHGMTWVVFLGEFFFLCGWSWIHLNYGTKLSDRLITSFVCRIKVWNTVIIL